MLNKTGMIETILNGFQLMKSGDNQYCNNDYFATILVNAISVLLDTATISTPINSDIGLVGTYSYTGRTLNSAATNCIKLNETALKASIIALISSSTISEEYAFEKGLANCLQTAYSTMVTNAKTSGEYVVPGDPPTYHHAEATPTITSFVGVPSDIYGRETEDDLTLPEGLIIFSKRALELAKSGDALEGFDLLYAQCLADCVERFTKHTGCLTLTYTTPVSCVVKPSIS